VNKDSMNAIQDAVNAACAGACIIIVVAGKAPTSHSCSQEVVQNGHCDVDGDIDCVDITGDIAILLDSCAGN